MKKSIFAFYVSVVMYALFIFLTQWSLTAGKMNNIVLSDTLSKIVILVILPTILLLVVYIISINLNYYVKHKWFTILFLISILLLAIVSKSISFTLPLLLGFVGFSASNRVVAKIVVLLFGTLLTLSWALSMLGFNGGATSSKPLFGVDSAEVSTVTALGLSNPNAVMIIFFHIIALLLYLCRTKTQAVLATFVLLALTVIISVATGSTTGIIIGFVTVFLVIISKYSQNGVKFFKRFTPWMFLIITLLSFVVAINFGSSDNTDNEINTTLTGRPHLWNLRIEDGSYINIFGNNDNYQMLKSGDSISPTFALDNMTIYILVYFGIIIYIIFHYTFYKGSKNITEPELLAYIFAAALLMFMEKMELYSLVLLFLQKSITEHYFLKDDNKRIHNKTLKLKARIDE